MAIPPLLSITCTVTDQLIGSNAETADYTVRITLSVRSSRRSLDLTALPPQVGANQTRLRILLAGLKLFGARGYHGTSIRDIAAEAGMQSASLYSYFTSKEAILAELVFIGHDAHHQLLLNAVLEADPGPTSQLRSLMTAHVAAHCRYPDLGVVSNYERHHLSPEAYAPADALRSRSVQLLTDVVARGKAQGAFAILDDITTVGALGAMGLSALNWYASYDGPMTADEVGAHYADLALRMVGA